VAGKITSKGLNSLKRLGGLRMGIQWSHNVVRNLEPSLTNLNSLVKVSRLRPGVFR